MKVTVDNKDDKKEVEFPWIGIEEDDGLIVLFNDEETGTVLSSGKTNWSIGDYDNGWARCAFKEFTGTITLGN